MDRIKQVQLTNIRVWCRRFGVEYNEARAMRAIETASTYPGMEGSTRRLPLALIFYKKIGEDFPEIPVEIKRFLSCIFATVMVAKVYDGDNTPWEKAVHAELYRCYDTDIAKASTVVKKIEPLIVVTGEWYHGASMARERESQSLGSMLCIAIRNPQLMGD